MKALIEKVLHAIRVYITLAVYHIKMFLGLRVTLDELATVGEQLRYGYVAGDRVFVEAAWAASQSVYAKSGRFVKMSSGYLAIAGDGDTELVGFAEHREETSSSTAGNTKTQLDRSLNSIYKIPINSGTLTRAMFYKTCDISVSSTVQGVQLDASSEDTLMIVGGDVANNKWVLVQLNPIKLGATGVV